MFSVGKKLNSQDQAKREAADREREAGQFDLVGTGGFLTVVKYTVFGILAALNFRLFYTVVPGEWGLTIAATSVLFEAFAVYGWNNQKRSSGMHRTALVWIALLFTGVSFVHASVSFYALVGLGPEIGRPLYVYSHYVAFPLLFTMMTAGVCVLYFTHWSKETAKAQAENQTQIAVGRADLIRRTAQLRSESELERAELAHYEEKLNTESSLLEVLRRAVTIEQEKAKLLNQITDPHTRRRMAELLERDDNQDGVADVLQQPKLRQEAHSLLNGEDKGYYPKA